MPESRSRKKSDHTPPAGKKRPPGKPAGNRWAAPLMMACWLIGLAWVVVYYIAGDRIPVMEDFGNWNILAGMGLIAVGFVFATKWE